MPSSVNTCCLRIIPILNELDITICDFQFSFLVYWFGGQVVGGNKKEKSASIEIQLLADFRGVRDEIRTHTAQRPLPPQSSVSTNSTTRTFGQVALNLSEKRDSNPRPQPWQGCALPTELFSRWATCFFRDCDAKVGIIFKLPKLIGTFFAIIFNHY